MSSLDILKSIYKPYRYTKNGNVTIVYSSSGNFVIKGQNKDLFGLFNYLESRGFTSFPKLVRNYRNEENVFEYLEEENIPKNQKMEELISTLASLHNKTVHFKDTNIDNFKEIKELVEENITYQRNFYEGLFLNACKDEFQSPSEYLFVRNYYKLKQNLAFVNDEINNWYDLVSSKKNKQ